MHPRWRYLVSLLGALAVAGLGWWLFPTDARRIRAACHELAKGVSMAPNEAEIARLTRVAQLAKHLAEDVVIEAEGMEARIEGREQVLALVGRTPGSARGLTVTLDDVEVIVGEDRRSARAEVAVTARELDGAGRTEGLEHRSLTLAWVRNDEGWRLARATVGPALDLP